jgi:hypothetical protein
MKAYDCALLRVEQAVAALCRPLPSAECEHDCTMEWPGKEVVRMAFTEPMSLLVNMPTFTYCTFCGQCLTAAWRIYDTTVDTCLGYQNTPL